MKDVEMLLVPLSGPMSKVTVEDWDHAAQLLGVKSVEKVTVGETLAMLVDEQGAIFETGLNALGSVLYGTLYHATPVHGPVLVGWYDRAAGPMADFVTVNAENLLMAVMQRVTERLAEGTRTR